MSTIKLQAVILTLVFSAQAFWVPLVAKTLNGIDLRSDAPMSINLAKAKVATAVVFLSSRCPCSASHEAELAALQQEFSEKGIQFVGVHSNTNERTPEDLAYFKDARFNFPILDDSKAQWANEFGADKTPHAFLISPSGKRLYFGAVSNRANFTDSDQKYLRNAITQILVNKPVHPEKTLSLGCIIRR